MRIAAGIAALVLGLFLGAALAAADSSTDQDAPDAPANSCIRPDTEPVRNRGSHPGPPVTWRTFAR